MTHIPRSGPIKAFAFVLALIGATLFGAPRPAQAAPAIVSTEIAGPATGITEIRYGHHWRHHGHRHHRHFGHRRHFGHHYGHRRHHYGRHSGHHHGRHFGRPHFY